MIVFVSNFLNQHQFPVARRLYEMTGGAYRFIEASTVPDQFLKNGYPEFRSLPWLINMASSAEQKIMGLKLIAESDVVIYGGSEFLPMVKERIKAQKMTFEYGERWLKKGLINFLSPRLLKSWWYYKMFFKENVYRLNASAYATRDLKLMGAFKDKCFKWGYFTETESPECLDEICRKFDNTGKVRVMFVTRFLDWKHPEMPVRAMKCLIDNGIDAELDIYGSGELGEKIAAMIDELRLQDYVHLKGNVPNDEIHRQMADHHILLFTSDRNEGWGAVVNEAMANGCVVIGSDAIGSIPFLIHDGENGLIFKNLDQNDLNSKLLWASNNFPGLKNMAQNAYATITGEWSPETAANRLLTLIDNLNNGDQTPFKTGPCSIAELI